MQTSAYKAPPGPKNIKLNKATKPNAWVSGRGMKVIVQPTRPGVKKIAQVTTMMSATTCRRDQARTRIHNPTDADIVIRRFAADERKAIPAVVAELDEIIALDVSDETLRDHVVLEREVSLEPHHGTGHQASR